MGRYDRTHVAALIDHTLLKPEAVAADVDALVREADELGVYCVCVSPTLVSTAVAAGDVLVASVVGFPSGKHVSALKAQEATHAVEAGAAEIDMVIDVGAAVLGDLGAVRADVAAVRAAIGEEIVLKVIVESAVILDVAGDGVLVDVCTAAAGAGADYVKTSTGFHPAGGASTRAVELMAGAVAKDGVGVKASGGIRTAADALAMLDAGATRLGLSASRAVLEGLD